jgi:hypothetical protein
MEKYYRTTTDRTRRANIQPTGVPEGEKKKGGTNTISKW